LDSGPPAIITNDNEAPPQTNTADLADDGDENNQRDSIIERISTMVAHVTHSGEHLVSAFLVEDVDEEVVFAEPVGFFERKYKSFIFATCFLLVVIATGILVNNVLKGDYGQVGLHKVSEGGRDELYCDPCIDRTTYTIKVLLNGDDFAGEKLASSARQSAKDMGVNLDIDYYMKESGQEQMAADIRFTAAAWQAMDALVMDITSRAVALAVRFAAENGMPVFGMNSGFEFASGPEGPVEDGSMLFFTAMDDRLGGEMAASYFLQQFSGVNGDGMGASSAKQAFARKKYARALFVAYNTSTYERIYQGYRDRLMEASNNTIEVEWLVVRPSFDKLLAKKLSGCMYQSVLIGEDRHIPPIARVVKGSGCNRIKMGSFGTHREIGSLMAEGEMDFTLDYKHHLHGWTAVQFAALYITTGLVIAPPQGGVYLSGPTFMTKDNYTKEIMSICNKENTNGTNDLPPDHECIHRNTISIGGVVHGSTTDKFWDTVFSAANQSAIDMGIDLKFD
jgi:ABC-type sugar transport system substrate-binding protein